MAGVDEGWRDDVTGEPLEDETPKTDERPAEMPDTHDKREQARRAEAEEAALYMAEFYGSDADEERKRALTFLDWQASRNRKAHGG